MKLKRARTCVGCKAYSDAGTSRFLRGPHPYGVCMLQFDVEQLGGNTDLGKFGSAGYWSVRCKPNEPCYKPTTIREYAEAIKLINPPPQPLTAGFPV